MNSKNRLNLDAFLNPVVLNLMLHASVGVSEMPPPLLPPMARCEIMFPPSATVTTTEQAGAYDGALVAERLAK